MNSVLGFLSSEETLEKAQKNETGTGRKLNERRTRYGDLIKLFQRWRVLANLRMIFRTD